MQNYEAVTTFDPLMDDFIYGNESFVHCAQVSVRWFEDWSCDAYLSASRDIPGEEDEAVASLETDFGHREVSA